MEAPFSKVIIRFDLSIFLIKLQFTIQQFFEKAKQSGNCSFKFFKEILNFDEAIGSRIYEMSKDFIVEINEGQENNYRLR